MVFVNGSRPFLPGTRSLIGQLGPDSAKNSIERDIVSLVSIVLLFSGIILIGFSIYFYTTQSVLSSSISVNLGTGLITASVTAILLERFSRQAANSAQREIAETALKRIDETMFGPSGIQIAIQNQIRRGFEASEISVSELARSSYTDELKKTISNSGITSAYSNWSGLIPDGFFTSQTSVNILVKDGTTLFKNRSDLLKNRFRIANQTTRIMIVHPEYEFMDAIASLDPYKSGSPETQKNEIIAVIRTMHTIRKQLIEDGIEIKNHVDFIGYRSIPSWTGYIGNSFAYIHFFFSRPYRGNLNTLFIFAKDRNGNATAWYESYQMDADEIWRAAVLSKDHNLWDYVLPN